MDKTSLGDRMKAYENIERKYLTRRLPTIIRIDGCHFHSYTRKFEKPFDQSFLSCMRGTAQMLCENIMGAKLAYTQSDEISLLLTDDDALETDAWFGKNLQKIVSVSAAMATTFFNGFVKDKVKLGITSEGLESAYYENIAAFFDARAFVLPHAEVLNYFVWRQQDCIRNAIQMVGHTNFSQKELTHKSCKDIEEMLARKGVGMENYLLAERRGVCIRKKDFARPTPEGEWTHSNVWAPDYAIPIFHESPDYINDLVYHR